MGEPTPKSSRTNAQSCSPFAALRCPGDAPAITRDNARAPIFTCGNECGSEQSNVGDLGEVRWSLVVQGFHSAKPRRRKLSQR